MSKFPDFRFLIDFWLVTKNNLFSKEGEGIMVKIGITHGRKLQGENHLCRFREKHQHSVAECTVHVPGTVNNIEDTCKQQHICYLKKAVWLGKMHIINKLNFTGFS